MFFFLTLAKAVYYLSRFLNLGSGFTWPGHLLLFFFPDFIEKETKKLNRGALVVTGTNGKTTTSQALSFIFRKNGLRVVTNASGANLLNGIASALVSKLNLFGRLNADLGIFEVDEAAFPEAVHRIRPQAIILLNLFRDQLDRYGEVDSLALKWQQALSKLPPSTKLFVNANDPTLVFLAQNFSGSAIYFGLDDARFGLGRVPHHADSVFCWHCNSALDYKVCYFSHLGIWVCPKCGWRLPKIDVTASEVAIGKEQMTFKVGDTQVKTKITGLYNIYNLLSVFSLLSYFNIPRDSLVSLMSEFSPHFGRQEEFWRLGRKIKILLSKNPTGFNENLRLLNIVCGKTDRLLLVLNDGIADGTDVSWIYDVDFENFPGLFQNSFAVSGQRAFDLALRLKYAGLSPEPYTSKDLKAALGKTLRETPEGGILYILPTYTAMLATRKVLVGKELL